MTNRLDMLERLRLELGDTGASTVWSDSLLYSLLDEAMDWYSRLFPMPAQAYRDITEGQTAVPVPPGVLQVAQVECPPGRVLPQEANAPLGQGARVGLRQSWSLWAGTIYLGNPASGAEVGTGKLIMQVLMPWDRLDTGDEWPGPADGLRLVMLWAAAEAWAWLDGQDQKRGRPGKAGAMVAQTKEQLEREVGARGRAAKSRRLETE